ncbi:MAG: hypothetical protein ACOY5W_00835 [Pseudomonadota bacterium]
MATDEELRKLREASQQSAGIAGALLDDELRDVMKKLDRIDELKPKTADPEVYEKLVHEIEKATQQNLSLATLRHNIESLGGAAVSLFKEIAGKAKLLA